MWKYPEADDLLHTFEKNAKVAGVIFIILGLIGVMFPVFASMATVVFVAWLMMIAGLMAGWFTYQSNKGDWAGWLKSVILIGVSLYMLFSPLGGVATLGMLFSIYFFMDAFSGFMIASSTYPQSGWFMWLINAILSMIIAIIFIVGWPFTSTYLIGLLVGFSLFFDGLALLMGAKIFGKMIDGK